MVCNKCNKRVKCCYSQNNYPTSAVLYPVNITNISAFSNNIGYINSNYFINNNSQQNIVLTNRLQQDQNLRTLNNTNRRL